MVERNNIEAILKKHGYEDYRWTRGADVIVRQWVRFKCMFGCSTYGIKGACPPETPSVAECREFFGEYEHILVIHIPKRLDQPEERREWGRKVNQDLLEVEKAVFLAGCQKAFLLFMDECRLCAKCGGTRVDCKKPQQARPCPEGLGVDVFGTVRSLGYPIGVLNDYQQEMNRYAFLLVE